MGTIHRKKVAHKKVIKIVKKMVKVIKHIIHKLTIKIHHVKKIVIKKIKHAKKCVKKAVVMNKLVKHLPPKKAVKVVKKVVKHVKHVLIKIRIHVRRIIRIRVVNHSHHQKNHHQNS